ncbi:MAG: sigma-70 family RNA polymerase sigma factor [Clostridia bacterium]|nr:sigma-70 family RNA polymerase sigma factor [Clostridia bacterium]
MSLWKQIKKGNEKAFEELLVRYENRVFAYAYHMLANHADAEDVTQEVFIKLWSATPQFRGEASLSTWIFRITRNACIDFLRQRREDVQSLYLQDEDGSSYQVDLVDEEIAHNPSAYFAREEQIEMVRAAIRELPLPYREILILRDYEGLSYEEIASLLSLELGTVRSRISRGRLKLKKILEGRNFLL